MIFRILSGVCLSLCLLIIGLTATVGGEAKFASDNAWGATANAVQNIRPLIVWCTLAMMLTIGMATREIVAALAKRSEVASEYSPPRRHITAPPVPDAPPAPAAPVLGQRPGESLEAWAARMEKADIAAFKARTGR